MAAIAGSFPPLEGSVSPEWLKRGIWLAQAAEIMADGHLVQEWRGHAARFTELREGETPVVFEMTSNLSGKERENELVGRLWRDDEISSFRLWLRFRDIIKRNIKDKLNAGHLVGFWAKDSPASRFEWIPPQAWFYMRIDHDEGNVVRGEGVAYWHVRVLEFKRYDEERVFVVREEPLTPPARGPEAAKTNAVAEKMRERLRSGLAPEMLQNMKQEAMAAEFEASRQTCVRARDLVFGKLRQKP